MKPASWPLSLTDAERQRVEHIDRRVALGAQGVPELLGMLSDRSWSVRRAVVAGLAALGDPAVAALCTWLRDVRATERGLAAAVDALVASRAADVDATVLGLTADPSPAVVADAIQVLGRRRVASATGTLGQLIHHPDDNVAVAAIEALGRIGGAAAVESLVEAARGDSFFRTFAAIDILGRIEDPRVVAPLAALLADTRYAIEAARALGRTGDRRALAPLATLLLRPGDATVRLAATSLAELLERHLSRFGPSAQLEQELRRAVLPFKERLMQALGRLEPAGLLDPADPARCSVVPAALCLIAGLLGDASFLPLLTALLDADPAIAGPAAEAIQRLGRESEGALLGALREGDSTRRAALLPLISRATLQDGVCEVLTDPDPEVRALGCEALARMGDTAVVPRLFQMLADPLPRVAQAAQAAIQTLGSDRTEALALGAARSTNAAVRRSALRILSYFGFPSAYEVFAAVLDEKDEPLHELAVYGLAFVEHPRALLTLRLHATAPSARVRAAVMRALGHCAAEPPTTAVLQKALDDPDPWVRYYACQSLGKLSCEDALGALSLRLEDQAGQVRIAAIEALAQLRSEESWVLLCRAAEATDPDARRAALVGLGLSRRPAAVPVLIAAAREDDVPTRLVALSGLAQFPTGEALRELAEAAAGENEQVRAAAVSFLAESESADASQALIELARQADPRHPVHAVLSIGTGPWVVRVLSALLTADEAFAAVLTAALVRMNNEAAKEALFEAFTMPNVAARRAAAGALAEIGTPAAWSALRRAVTQDADPEVRRICAALTSGSGPWPA